ncbi:BACON domain-containing protein, partial [Tenacibaculum amylolyticum]|uniref:BACON domain-containing protein n=1 Tax=Tenacibaculum amylolyticum TaxID=104269 RepID=UPI0038B625D6
MALPISGEISIKDILVEMGQPTRTNVSLNTLAQEWLNFTGDLTFGGQDHKLSDWYGKVWRISIDMLNEFRISFQSNPSDGFGINNACSFTLNRTVYHNGTGGYRSAPDVGDTVFYYDGKIGLEEEILDPNVKIPVLGGTAEPFNGGGLSYKTEENKVIVIESNGRVRSVHTCQVQERILSITPTLIEEVPQSGGTYTVYVTCNGPWTVQIFSGQTESTVYPTSGNGNGTFRLSIKSSGAIDKLQLLIGEIRVSSGSKSVFLNWHRSFLFDGPGGGGPGGGGPGGGGL